MNNCKIKTKIIIAFGAIILLSCIFAGLVIFSNLSALRVLDGAAEPAAELDELAGIMQRALTLTAIFSAAALAAAIALIAYLSVNISNPLKFLAGAIAGIAGSGNIYLDDHAYKATKELNKRRDEIGGISRSTGDMLAMFRGKIKSLNAVAKGDLTTNIARNSGKDTIGTALFGMVEGLNSMFFEIHSASDQVSAGSQRLHDGTRVLAQGASEQASEIERLGLSVNAVAGQTAQNAQAAQEAAGLSESIKQCAEKGGEQMEEMIDAVTQINEAGNAISEVIQVIESIAFQTNILALNASVEAARAGVHGKGFAVVAQEVRNLAAKSQAAAKDTGNLINDSIGKAKRGAAIAGETAASLREIVDGVSQSALLIGEISRSSGEQAAAIAQINESLEQINRVVRQNSETAAQSADASHGVSNQSALLQGLITQFKIKNALPAGDRPILPEP